MKRIYLLLFAFILTGFYAVNSVANITNTSVTPVSASTNLSKQPLFINLTSDQPRRVDSALRMALDSLNNGHPVIIYLSIDGVKLANKSSPNTMLQKVIVKGGEVWVCPTSLKEAGFTSDNLIQGVELYNYQLLEKHFFDSDVKTLSY